MQRTIGFAVLYRWRLRAGKEAQFREAWGRVTQLLIRDRGALGSRLHRADDGTWYAYAQWPSREARDEAFAAGPVDAEASRLMREAEAEVFPAVLLDPVEDHLLHEPIAPRD